jgi:hypothetical protein
LALAEKISNQNQKYQHSKFDFLYLGEKARIELSGSKTKFTINKRRNENDLEGLIRIFKSKILAVSLSQDTQEDSLIPGCPCPVILNSSAGHIEYASRIADTKEAVSLPLLKYLDNKAAACFSQHRSVLSLKGLVYVDQPTAEELARHKSPIDLSGIIWIDDATAMSLSKHQGELVLSSLENLPDSPGFIALSGKLARFKGALDLSGLQYLGDNCAKELSRHSGQLTLSALRMLSDSEGHLLLAEKLSKQHKVLAFPQLVEIGIQAIDHLSSFKGDLLIPSLNELSDCAFLSLSKHQGLLDLSGIRYISSKAAQSLSKHRGRLLLGGLTGLGDEEGYLSLAEKLAAHKEDLDLSGLTSLGEIAAAALSWHSGILNLSGLEYYNKEVNDALRPHDGPIVFSPNFLKRTTD